MDERRVAVVSAVATVALALARLGTDVVLARVMGNLRGTATLPTVGSLGQTATLYVQATEALAPLVTTGVAVGVGVYLGRRVDVRRAHRDLLRSVATGSGAVVALAALAMLLVNGVDAFGVLYALATALRFGATLTLPLVVGTLAGAALVAFEADEGDGEGEVTGAEPRQSRERAVEDADVR